MGCEVSPMHFTWNSRAVMQKSAYLAVYIKEGVSYLAAPNALGWLFFSFSSLPCIFLIQILSELRVLVPSFCAKHLAGLMDWIMCQADCFNLPPLILTIAPFPLFFFSREVILQGRSCKRINNSLQSHLSQISADCSNSLLPGAFFPHLAGFSSPLVSHRFLSFLGFVLLWWLLCKSNF